MSTRASLGSSYERSISIEDTSDSDSAVEQPAFSLGKNTIDPHNFETDINRLKAESSSKFKRRWDEIIAKFSTIDDEKESDEIDLHSGKITRDNGHLRSLRSNDNVIDGVRVHSSIWAGDYDFDKQLQHQKRQQKNVSQNKHELKQKLKAERRFHYSSAVTSDSDALEDNLSILGSSPTKKHKHDRENLPDSPFSTSSPAPLLMSPPPKGAGSSPLKNHMVHSSPSGSPKRGRVILSQDLALNPPSPHYKPSPHYYDPNSYYREQSKDHEQSMDHEQFSDSQYESPDQQEQSDSDEKSDTEQIDSSFEQNSLLEWHQVPELALYTCAFRDCGMVAEDRSSYRIHLLQAHSAELQEIGYPIVASPQKKTPFVDEITILKLNLHFPLQVELPKSDPYVCDMAVGGRPCKKLFFSKTGLIAHRRASPVSCSARRQVLPCPILGCTFMTDVSFEDYRNHVLSHHVEASPKKSYTKQTEADVSDYFSDSVSSLSFSDSEPESKTEQSRTDPEQSPLKTKTLRIIPRSATSTSKIRSPPTLDIVD